MVQHDWPGKRKPYSPQYTPSPQVPTTISVHADLGNLLLLCAASSVIAVVSNLAVGALCHDHGANHLPPSLGSGDPVSSRLLHTYLSNPTPKWLPSALFDGEKGVRLLRVTDSRASESCDINSHSWTPNSQPTRQPSTVSTWALRPWLIRSKSEATTYSLCGTVLQRDSRLARLRSLLRASKGGLEDSYLYIPQPRLPLANTTTCTQTTPTYNSYTSTALTHQQQLPIDTSHLSLIDDSNPATSGAKPTARYGSFQRRDQPSRPTTAALLGWRRR